MADNHDDSLGRMVRSIEDARAAGKTEGVEACIRFLTEDPSRTVADLQREMQRRTWITQTPTPTGDKQNDA